MSSQCQPELTVRNSAQRIYWNVSYAVLSVITLSLSLSLSNGHTNSRTRTTQKHSYTHTHSLTSTHAYALSYPFFSKQFRCKILTATELCLMLNPYQKTILIPVYVRWERLLIDNLRYSRYRYRYRKSRNCFHSSCRSLCAKNFSFLAVP